MNVYKLFLNLLFVLLANFAFSQRGIVQGTMLDNNGEPLIGMNILIKGNQQGTITDMDGNYRIECNVGDVLVFSYIGLTTQQKTVSLDMFKIVVDPTAPEKTVQAPQLPIKSKAYADLIKKNKADSENFIDMNYKPYKWKYKNFIYDEVYEDGSEGKARIDWFNKDKFALTIVQNQQTDNYQDVVRIYERKRN